MKRLLDESRASDHSINLSSYPNTEKMKELLGMSRKEKHNVDLSLVPTIEIITKNLPTMAAIETQFKSSNSSNKALFTNIRQDVSFLGREIGQLMLKPSFDTLYELLEKGIQEQTEKSAGRILQTITADHWSEVKQHLTAEKAAILSGFKAEGSTKASSEELNRLQRAMAIMSKTSNQSRDEVSSLHEEVMTIKDSKTKSDEGVLKMLQDLKLESESINEKLADGVLKTLQDLKLGADNSSVTVLKHLGEISPHFRELRKNGMTLLMFFNHLLNLLRGNKDDDHVEAVLSDETTERLAEQVVTVSSVVLIQSWLHDSS
jgi:hypothetical protein